MRAVVGTSRGRVELACRLLAGVSLLLAGALAGAGACSQVTEIPPDPVVCAGAPTSPVLTSGGDDSGFVRCPDGTIHRAARVACEPVVAGPSCVGDEDQLNCTSDADCQAAPHGRCVSGLSVGGGTSVSYCMCSYGCATDDDCDTGEVCVCAGVTAIASAYCVRAECALNAECPSDECSISLFDDGCGTHVWLACRSEADTCRVGAECTTPGPHACESVPGTFDYGEHFWRCRTFECVM